MRGYSRNFYINRDQVTNFWHDIPQNISNHLFQPIFSDAYSSKLLLTKMRSPENLLGYEVT